MSNKLRYIFLSSVVLFTLGIGQSCLATAKDSETKAETVKTLIKAPKKTLANINKADALNLEKVKGISKIKAKAIIEYRSKNGPFKSLKGLLKVKARGIHEAWLEKVGKYLSV